MATVDVDNSNLQADSRPESVDRISRRSSTIHAACSVASLKIHRRVWVF